MMDLQNVPAEQHVLGAAMLWPESVDAVSLAAEDFSQASHASIWQAIRTMLDAGLPVDVLTVADAMDRKGALDRVGGLPYLSELAQAVYSPANVNTHASQVRDRAIRRGLLAALRDIGEAIGSGDVADVLESAQARIMAIGARAVTREPVRVSSIVAERINVLDEIFAGNDDGLSTGLTDLDRMLGKVRPGDMMVVAGRPGMGKSSFAMQLAEAMATESKPALFFSLEMSAVQFVDRIMVSAGRINLKKFRTAEFDESDWDGLTVAAGRTSELPVYIDDHSHSLSQILTTMRAFKRRHGGVGPVVIDYIGLVQSDGDTREQEVARITRALKMAAKQLGCPVIALSQLNRKLEDRADKRPMQADLRESGAVEQDADSILMLYRDEVYNPDGPNAGMCEILIRKNRHGETGMVPTVFRKETVRFENFAGSYDPAPAKPSRRYRGDI